MKVSEIPALLEEDIRRVAFADPGSEITLSTGAVMYARSVTWMEEDNLVRFRWDPSERTVQVEILREEQEGSPEYWAHPFITFPGSNRVVLELTDEEWIHLDPDVGEAIFEPFGPWEDQ